VIFVLIYFVVLVFQLTKITMASTQPKPVTLTNNTSKPAVLLSANTA